MNREFSYQNEKEYYAGRPVTRVQPYDEAEPYVNCWLDGRAVFGGKRVLDIGAGECVYSRLILNKFAPRMLVTMDLIPERMLAAVTEKRLHPVGGDCYSLPFQDQSFEVVFASLLLQRLPALERIVYEIRRALAPKGTYIGIESNYWHFINLYRHFLRGAEFESRNVYVLFSGRIRAAFEQQGFQVRLKFFYAPVPWLRGRFLGTLVGIVATLP